MWLKNDQLPLTHALHPFKNSENTPQSEKFPQSPKTGTKMTNISKFTIKSATSPTDLVAIKHLFTAYASSLGIDLSFQSFTTELDSLPGLYSSPSGALFLALTPENEAIGVVGLRPLLKTSKSGTSSSGDEVENSDGDRQEKKICEMKRLYCTPSSSRPWCRTSTD